jgi:cobalamin biosynthesis protein CbiD
MSRPVGKYMETEPPAGDAVEEIEEKRIKLPGNNGVKVLTRKTVTYPNGKTAVIECSRIEQPVLESSC